MPRRSSRPRIPIRAMFPYVFRGSPIQSPSSKNPDIGFDETSVSGSANQAPIRSPRIPCADCRRGAACPDGAPIPPRPAAGPPRSTYPTDLLKFPATTGPLKPAHPTGLTTFPAPAAGPLKCAPGQLTQIPCADEGGMGTASPHDAAPTGALRSSRPRRPAPAAWIPGESGQTGPGKNPQVRRRIRGTDGRSRRPGPASRLRCAVGVPRLYLFEYPLQRFFDSFQFVVCLFLAFNKDVKPAVYSAVKHPCEYPQHAPLALYRY